MAAKKGKSKSAKVPSLKSKKLSADQAGHVKGGILISSTVAHKDMIANTGNAAWKLNAGVASWKLK